MQRISTGNHELDQILGGGLPRHSINIVMGLPGTGKTLLAEQLAFANGTSERPVLYLTTLSEPLAKLVSYLQELTFCEIDRIGTDVRYDSLVEVLQEHPERVIDECTRLIQEHRPGVIIIDSFKAIAELVPDRLQWRKVVFGLAGLFTAYDVTILWVGEYASAEVGSLPEFAIADGIVELQREEQGTRDDRFLRVIKLRGSDFRDGRHAFRISKSGLEVFPRLVGPGVLGYEPVPERLQTGITGLDEMIERGWLRGTSTLVEGSSGAGKTMLGLHFLRQGVADGEPGLLVSFQESPVQIRRTMLSLGWALEGLLGSHLLDHFHTSPVELHIDTIVQEMLRRIDANGVRRLVLDSLGDLQNAAGDRNRFHDYVYALTQIFAVRGITAMMSCEARPTGSGGTLAASSDISYMSDNIVLLSMDLGAELSRTIRIVKTRASAHDGASHILRIGRSGIEVD